jgi:hypothetical protein
MKILAGATLNLPLYERANPVRSLAALALVDALGRADGIILTASSYHDSIPGSSRRCGTIQAPQLDPQPGSSEIVPGPEPVAKQAVQFAQMQQGTINLFLATTPN